MKFLLLIDMGRIVSIILAMVVVMSASAGKYSCSYCNMPVSEALVAFSRDYSELNISFIYKELDNYIACADIDTDDPYEAIHKIIGFNPVSVVEKRGIYYVEALQRGKYVYEGHVIGTDNEPVVSATVMLMVRPDSAVVTYGVTDKEGHFYIPCDYQGVIAKLSCLGYKTVFHPCNSFAIGTIIMPEQSVKLGEVRVEADNASIYADRTVYIPTQRQKNAAQTGDDLLSRMGIPQLGLVTNGKVTTNSGKSVAVYIDCQPASDNDLIAMRVKDVIKVEYYVYPSDPRFQGKEHVINFIMQQYEYGGYVKGFGHANLISFSEQLLASTRLQYKKMKYDLMGYGWNMNSSHYGADITESFRLPDSEGTVNEFNRYSRTMSSKKESQQYLIAFRATYASDKIQASTEIDGSINNNPHSDEDGSVVYSGGMYPASTYVSKLNDRSRYIACSGHYYFDLPGNNSLSFNPYYAFSHTERNSWYKEEGFPEIQNSAIDNTNELNANINLSHDFGDYGSVMVFGRGNYEYNRTRYSGSAHSFDKAKSIRMGAGINYTLNSGNFNGMVGTGFDWDRLIFEEIDDNTVSPWFDLSLQYRIRKKHSFSAIFHYSTWQPSSSYKSDNVISSSPFMKYTGNPNLLPYKAYDCGLDYSWIPGNNFNLGAFAWAWTVGNRYAFVYEPAPDGIVRRIEQPIGSFANLRYGVNGSARFLDGALAITAQLAQILNHNGEPYNISHSFIYWYARVMYYWGKWNYSLTYISDKAGSDDCTNGYWSKNKNDWQFSVGWVDGDWNLKANIINMTRWNWRSGTKEMQSRYYSLSEQSFNGASHALVQVSATYTFGYGKKVRRDDEPSVSGAASSGILK